MTADKETMKKSAAVLSANAGEASHLAKGSAKGGRRATCDSAQTGKTQRETGERRGRSKRKFEHEIQIQIDFWLSWCGLPRADGAGPFIIRWGRMRSATSSGNGCAVRRGDRLAPRSRARVPTARMGPRRFRSCRDAGATMTDEPVLA